MSLQVGHSVTLIDAGGEPAVRGRIEAVRPTTDHDGVEYCVGGVWWPDFRTVCDACGKGEAASKSDRRCPWPLWIGAILLGGGALSVPIGSSIRRPSKPPGSLSELAHRITARHPNWRIVKAANTRDGLESGFWVCNRERSIEELSSLGHTAEQGHSWSGVVLCRFEDRSHAEPDRGQYGAIVGPIELFGDPHMVREIAGY